MNTTSGKWITLIILLVSFTACSDNSDDGPSISGIYVVNEGNFNQGNASVTVYNAEAQDVVQQAFESQNNRPLGDVANNITRIEDRLYIVVNNSHKIEVVNPDDLSSIGTISIPEQGSPRNIVKARDGIAYVTNLYANTVSIVDLESLSVTGSIGVGNNPEGIAVANQRAFVANSGLGSGNTVTVIDVTTDEVINTLDVGDNPTDMVKDAADRIWLVCTGAYNDYSDPNDDTPGFLYVINSGTTSITNSIELGGHPSDIAISNNEGKVFILNEGIQIIRTSDLKLEATWALNRSLYALGVSETNKTYVYGADPKNYAQQGMAIKYDMNGVPVDSFDTGIIPGSFYMEIDK
ncbi:MAG: YncE family protein [Bacteroidota bacterium]